MFYMFISFQNQQATPENIICPRLSVTKITKTNSLTSSVVILLVTWTSRFRHTHAVSLYRVGRKKLHTVFIAITLSTLNQFS